jgi:hypothetical protein
MPSLRAFVLYHSTFGGGRCGITLSVGLRSVGGAWKKNMAKRRRASSFRAPPVLAAWCHYHYSALCRRYVIPEPTAVLHPVLTWQRASYGLRVSFSFSVGSLFPVPDIRMLVRLHAHHTTAGLMFRTSVVSSLVIHVCDGRSYPAWWRGRSVRGRRGAAGFLPGSLVLFSLVVYLPCPALPDLLLCSCSTVLFVFFVDFFLPPAFFFVVHVGTLLFCCSDGLSGALSLFALSGSMAVAAVVLTLTTGSRRTGIIHR